MDQENYIRNSEIKGNVYNENIDNIIFPKNRGPSMLCKEVKVDNSGRIVAGHCLIILPEREFNAPIKRNFAHYQEALGFDYDFKDLSEDREWTLPEIALME